MAVELTYDIGQMRTYSNDDANRIVRYVELKLNGVNGNKIDSQIKSVLLSEPSDYSGFTEYDDLTKEQLITWAKSSLGTDEITAWENGITEYLNMPIRTGDAENPITEHAQPSGWSN